MRYLSVCSGIEAASVAWEHLGWTPVGFSEIERFPSAVLANRFPTVPNFGDMTQHESWPIDRGSIDILVGGTPCQSFSIAGLRRGLNDPRGNLMLTYLAIADRLRARYLVWENVHGILSSNGGRDFATLLQALGQLGYGWAYRVLDAQYIRVGRWPRAVPQRRRRVFVVARLIERNTGDWAAAAEILALREGVRGYMQASAAKGKGVAADAEECSGTVSSKWAKGTGGPAGDECYNLIAEPVPFRKSRRAQSVHDHESWVHAEQANTMNQFDVGERDTHAVADAMTVRRLTPRECERLQGFPDDWTMIPYRGKPPEECPDGPRYKALGNSMACNCMAWIGERIAAYENHNP